MFFVFFSHHSYNMDEECCVDDSGPTVNVILPSHQTDPLMSAKAEPLGQFVVIWVFVRCGASLLSISSAVVDRSGYGMLREASCSTTPQPPHTHGIGSNASNPGWHVRKVNFSLSGSDCDFISFGITSHFSVCR